MDLSTFLSPQVIAPTAGLVGVLVGAGISSWTTRSTHRERLVADRVLAERKIDADISLAERKFEFDKGLAEHKANLDADLAERKFTFDREFAAWRRRFDIAEQVLAAAYEARDALNWACGRGIFSGEGKTRTATEPESQVVKEARDLAYVPIERLQSHSKAFATLQTLQDSIVGHYGHEAAKPISEIFAVRHRITSAAALLIQNAAWNEDRDARRSLQPFRDELWGDRAKESNDRLDAAIKQLEALLRPILSASAPT